MRVDSFSGQAAGLRGKDRTPHAVLEALKRNPRVSTWDMSEHAWLRACIDQLTRIGAIEEVKDEPFPWHKFKVLAVP